MINRIIKSSLNAPGIVIIAIIALTIYGVFAYQQMPVDAFPDISPVMVPVFAEAHGMAPEEIERLVTYPIEASMNGLPKVKQIKSTSAFGMAVIYVYFHDDVDIYFARQLVSERLSSVVSELPKMDNPPTLGPISTGLGQIFIYYLSADPQKIDTGGKDVNTYLREVNDWIVKFQLQTVPGVTKVLSMGGHVLQYQIIINPESITRYQLSLNQVVEAVQANNRNVGGQFLVLGSEEHLIRGIGLLETLEDLKRIPVKVNNGTPIFLSDIAEVKYGNEIRRGVVTRNGKEEVISGIVMKLYGENTSKVIEKLYKKVEDIRKTLPNGIKLIPYYEQAELVHKATGTVKKALIEGGILVLIVLLVFLGNLRTAFIVALSLPLCALFSVILMSFTDISANLMSLGGIAIAIGMIGDGAIVMVENIFRHFGEKENRNLSKTEIVYKAAKGVSRPIVFSIAIIIIVFLPIFTLEGVEGKMFSPLAFSISFALIGSILVTLIVAPILSLLLLRFNDKAKEQPLQAYIKSLYSKLLKQSYLHKKKVITGAIILTLGSFGMLGTIGTEFIPTLEEGSILIGVTMAPSISLEKGTETIMAMERKILKNSPVREIVSRIGRPEAGSHPHPVNIAEIHLELKQKKDWGQFKSKAEFTKFLGEELKDFPGVNISFTQPIQNAFAELLSGTKATLSIKVYGEDLHKLKDISTQIQNSIDAIPGLVDLSSEQNFGQPQVQVIANREMCARYGVSISQVLEMVEMAVGGEVIDNIYMNTRKFGIHIRYNEKYRDEPEAIRNLLIATGDNTLIPLSQLAEVKKTIGPIQINREKNQRKWGVQGNIRGRALGDVVSDIQDIVDSKIKPTLPAGYHVEIGGQFENQQRAMRTLTVIVPLAIGLIFMMLWMTFNSLRSAFVIIINLPLALVGGIFGLIIMQEYLSVPASIGFIALFGIAVQDGMVMVTSFNDLRETGKSISDAIFEGAVMRLRPVLMTSATTVMGLFPLLLSQGIGSEVQRPLAIVVVFGLISSTVLTLFVVPAMYGLIEERATNLLDKK